MTHMCTFTSMEKKKEKSLYCLGWPCFIQGQTQCTCLSLIQAIHVTFLLYYLYWLSFISFKVRFKDMSICTLSFHMKNQI